MLQQTNQRTSNVQITLIIHPKAKHSFFFHEQTIIDNAEKMLEELFVMKL